MTIDSCVEDDRKTPTALRYLGAIGVDVQTQVTHNVITHPDSDHIGGICELFSECSNAQLVCPAALSEREFISYIAHHSYTDPTPLARASSTIYNLLELSTKRPPNRPIYAVQDRVLVDIPPVKIVALSPSDGKIARFIHWIVGQIPTEKAPRRAETGLLPNDVSAVVLMEVGDRAALFGADLEEARFQGWSDILNNSVSFASSAPIKLIKIPHHGSDNADCPALWMKSDIRTAILAPFKLGSVKLPTIGDVDRTLARTDRVFSSSTFSTKKTRGLSRADRILKQHGIRRSDMFPDSGQIRIRWNMTGEHTEDIRLTGPAVHLSKVHS